METERLPLLRSALYLPANRAGAVAKARQVDCDAVILDLEDAVAPQEKELAREAAIAAVAEGGFGDRTLVVRANGSETPWGPSDLAALAKTDVDAVLLPKVSSPSDLEQARTLLPEHISMWAMIETCGGIVDIRKICTAAQTYGVTTFVLGTNDLLLEMRCPALADRSNIVALLSQTIVAARAHGLAVLDGVYSDLSNDDGLTRECAQGAALGFDGKTLIHPGQIAAANLAFGPSEQQFAQARSIVEAFQTPENANKGVIRHDGRMIELLHLRAAERTIAQYEAIARRKV